MLLIHKETAEIYELRVVALSDEVFNLKQPISYGGNLFGVAYAIGLFTLYGNGRPIRMSYNEMADHFEILGWL